MYWEAEAVTGHLDGIWNQEDMLVEEIDIEYN
jgi:hypothetical protein